MDRPGTDVGQEPWHVTTDRVERASISGHSVVVGNKTFKCVIGLHNMSRNVCIMYVFSMYLNSVRLMNTCNVHCEENLVRGPDSRQVP